MVADTLHDWWVKALLGQQQAAHPIFGTDLHIDVDDGIVTLRGRVEDEQQAEEVEREARHIGGVREVINHLVVKGPALSAHHQTVIALFPSAESAELACNAIATATFHDSQSPDMMRTKRDARRCLTKLARAAGVPPDSVQTYVDLMGGGKILMVDRVPELDALRLVSALEGSTAEHVWTLPPEPATGGAR